MQREERPCPDPWVWGMECMRSDVRGMGPAQPMPVPVRARADAHAHALAAIMHDAIDPRARVRKTLHRCPFVHHGGQSWCPHSQSTAQMRSVSHDVPARWRRTPRTPTRSRHPPRGDSRARAEVHDGTNYSGVKFFRTSALARRRSSRWVTVLVHRPRPHPRKQDMGRRDQYSRPRLDRINAL